MIQLKKEINELCDLLGPPPRYPLEFEKETKRFMPSEAPTGKGVGAAPRIHAEVESRFGVLPNFFRLAPESPEITANLWGFARFAYLDNPLPSLFKERLFVYLSRFCEVHYCIVRHLGFLVGLGRPSGDERSPVQAIEEVLRLLRRTLPRGVQAEPHIARCAAPDAPLAALPPPDSDMEEAMFTCAAHAFLQTPDAPRCLIALKRALGEVRFEHLMVFLAFVQTAHYWTKIHPELKFEEDIEQLLAAHEGLAECLFNDPEAETCEISQRLLDELNLLRETKEQHDDLLRAQQTAPETQERLKRTNDELAQRIAELQKANIEIRESRRAALNVMEDALQARQQVEVLNRQLQKENSECRQAEEALRESEHELADFFENSAVGLHWVGADGRILRVNQAELDLLGYTRDEYVGHDIAEFHVDQEVIEDILQRLARGETLQGYEARLRCKGGAIKHVLIDSNVLWGKKGEFIHTRCLTHDITERKLAEETLRESGERFRFMAESMPQKVFTATPDGQRDYFNPQWFEYTGASFEQVKDWGWTQFLHPDDKEETLRRWKHSIETGEPFEFQNRYRHADGEYRWHLSRARAMRDAEGKVRLWIGSNTDINDQKRAEEWLEKTVAERTEELRQANAALLRDMEARKKLEEQLLQAQKMEGIGTLAGGIAHDFNNILNIIQGYTFILRGHGSHNRQMEENLTVINETVQRGTALVQQLLTLARKSSTELEPVNANAVIEGLIALVTQTFAKTIELSRELEADLPPIMADKNHIEQALLNLCVNARDAMPNGGRLTFRTQSVDGASLQRLGETTQERYVCIEVSDTGMGMDESVRQRIFEPFFTTKDEGQGTGLGLSVVYGIVKSHNGFIDVESRPMSGTSFRLYFPIAPSEVSTKEPVVTRDTKIMTPSNGGATVLLVEDEEHMLSLLEKILLKHGYKVFKASDGESAITTYQGHKQTIDVVLLDMGLPKLAGRDVLLRLKDEKPDLKVIISSGYLEPELKSEIDLVGVRDFLNKPYMPEDAVRTLQSLIESESSVGELKSVE